MTDDTTPSFADLGLPERLLEPVHALGFTHPTPIQAAAIPPMLAGDDIIGRARTGSGKTAAFGLPLLARLLERDPEAPRRPRALVVAPTRELAVQVAASLAELSGSPPVPHAVVYGGSSYRPQIRDLQAGVPLVVGTPGRLIDHLEKGNLDLSGIELVVLDEADEMLRMGFIDDIERLLGETPEGRQVALFSATMPPPIRRVASRYLKDPTEVQVEKQALSVGHIKQRWIRVPEARKLDALIRLLQAGVPDDSPDGATLVFCRTREGTGQLAHALRARGFSADALHGDLNQAAREKVLNALRAGHLRVLVATDVAARGLDVDHIEHVINFDPPHDTEAYVHRIGRTGRAGRLGHATLVCTPAEVRKVRRLERALKVTLTPSAVPSDAALVGAQQRRLIEELSALPHAAPADDETDDEQGEAPRRAVERSAVESLLAQTGWDALQLATAALELVARDRGMQLFEEPDEHPPKWGRAPKPVTRRPAEPVDWDQVELVELFFPVGYNRRIRPADLVGALAHEGGIPGSHIGRITVLPNKSFVSLPRPIAQALLDDLDRITVRGRTIPLKLAHPRGPRPPGRGPGGHGGHGPPERRRGPRRHAPGYAGNRGNQGGRGRR